MRRRHTAPKLGEHGHFLSLQLGPAPLHRHHQRPGASDATSLHDALCPAEAHTQRLCVKARAYGIPIITEEAWERLVDMLG